WLDWPPGRRKSTSSRCAGWLPITGARRTSSARKRCGPTCSACARAGRHAAHSRPASTGCVSSIAIRLTACGDCSGKKRIASPRQKRLPESLSEDQVRHLLGIIRNPVHKMCLAVMYACGLRISEATTLEIGAIDRANLVLRIVGKGNKERLVPLPQPVLDELGRLWLTDHNRRWLFPNHRGDAPLNPRVLARLIQRIAGIQKRLLYKPLSSRHELA